MKEGANNALPRWRGFNLLYFFTSRSDCAPVENDFRWIADWGFDFVRLPMCYLLWTDKGDVFRVKNETLESIDEAVEIGRQYGIHVSLNFHRAPGYSVNQECQEPFDLWKDQEALDAFCYHWELFAGRYKGIPAKELSFDLVNEPPKPTDSGMSLSDHKRVVQEATQTIKHADPGRPVIADGLSWGNDPIPELADLQIGQSCRGYLPMGISHFQAPWVGGERFPKPVWPGSDNFGETWDRQRLERHYCAWSRLLDSGRDDVSYNEWHGHLLDERLLKLMQQH